MKRLTASRAALAFSCSYFLHDHVELLESPPGPWAVEGTVIHAMIEDTLRGDGADPRRHLEQLQGDVEAIARVERKFHAWEAWADGQQRIGWHPELAIAYDPRADVARELDAKHHRDYSGARDGEMAMQLDVVTMGEDADGPYAEVIDWKSGQDSAYAAAQLNVGGLAWARVVGVDRVRVRAVYIAEDGVSEKSAWLTTFDLDMVRGHIKRVLESPDPEPRPGPHCSGLWCAARHACPATVQALAEVSKASPEAMARLVAEAITTPVAAGDAHVRLRVIKDAVKAVEERIRAVVEEHGYAPCPNGKVLRVVSTTRESFSRSRLPKDQAERILGELRDVGALAESTSSYVKECAR